MIQEIKISSDWKGNWEITYFKDGKRHKIDVDDIDPRQYLDVVLPTLKPYIKQAIDDFEMFLSDNDSTVDNEVIVVSEETHKNIVDKFKNIFMKRSE